MEYKVIAKYFGKIYEGLFFIVNNEKQKAGGSTNPNTMSFVGASPPANLV